MAKSKLPESNADRALTTIKAAIIDGSLPPGSVATEHELAAKLGMSRTPVHQALDRLRSDGWVSIVPRVGVRVSGIDPDEIRDIYETLRALEGAAVQRLASALPPDECDTDARILAAAELCERELEVNDLRGWANADNEFHTLLLRESGNKQLLRVAGSVMEHAHRARLLTVNLRPRPEQSNHDHREILEAIRARRPAAARTALEAHRQRGIDTLVPILESMYSRPAFLEQ